MVLIPDLATDLGRPNDDFTEWTFTIREGVKYENGEEVTPEDIAYGIKRSFDRETFPRARPSATTTSSTATRTRVPTSPVRTTTAS